MLDLDQDAQPRRTTMFLSKISGPTFEMVDVEIDALHSALCAVSIARHVHGIRRSRSPSPSSARRPDRIVIVSLLPKARNKS